MSVGGLAAVAALIALSKRYGSEGQGARVYNSAALAGVHPRLQEFFEWWRQAGPFDLIIPTPGFAVETGTVPSWVPPGGVRSLEWQTEALSSGMSAASPSKSPHPRGGAVDAWPVDFVAHVNGEWRYVPAGVKAQFEAYGEAGEAAGLVWGGRWRSATFPNGDQPHLEVPGWQALEIVR